MRAYLVVDLGVDVDSGGGNHTPQSTATLLW